MAEDKKNDQEQQELDELTVLQDAEKEDLSAEEYVRVAGVEETTPEQSDLAGTVLSRGVADEDVVPNEIPVDSPEVDLESEGAVDFGDLDSIVSDIDAAEDVGVVTEARAGIFGAEAGDLVRKEIIEADDFQVDALETDFFLMDGDDGSSWTEVTEEVESNDDEGRDNKGDDDDGDSFEDSDNLDAFENEAEDFPDQSDW